KLVSLLFQTILFSVGVSCKGAKKERRKGFVSVVFSLRPLCSLKKLNCVVNDERLAMQQAMP
ncbi:MAG TPA: hypothetical protein VER36_10410, partial [Flavisolibacter sp.]|nr:hypothetical protein [Flavisolibacter sp.]